MNTHAVKDSKGSDGSQGTYNINANLTQSLEAANENYVTVSNLVTLYMGLAEAQTANEASLTNQFDSIEHSPTDPVSKTDPTPPGDPYGFQNCIYQIQNSTSTDPAQTWGPIYTSDNSEYNSILQEMGAVVSQLNQVTGQNTSNEQSSLGIGNAVATFMQGISRLIQA